MSAGGGLLSASSTEGGFSEVSPMSPETPGFFGGGGSGNGRVVILSEVVGGSTVTSPNTCGEMVRMMKVDGVVEGGIGDGDGDGGGKGGVGKIGVEIESVESVDVSLDRGGELEGDLVAVS